MAAACEALGVPVVSGNVSLYNESYGAAIYPTPVVGALSVFDDVSKVVPSGFVAAGDVVYILGARAEALTGRAEDLAGSEYLRQVHGLIAGQPRIDLALEERLQQALIEAADLRLLRSAHDCSHGGLAVTLAEACFASNVGFATDGVTLTGRLDAALFGEAPSRVIATASPEQVASLEELLNRLELPFLRLGTTGGDRLRIADYIDESLDTLRAAYEGGLEAALREG
jgi:phosphoribosylformylglycinamidine synthase